MLNAKHKNTKYTKYTNTAYDKVAKKTTCGIFLKRELFKNIKNNILMCQMQNTKIQNTQIQHMTKWQKPPTCSVFIKKRIIQGF